MLFPTMAEVTLPPMLSCSIDTKSLFWLTDLWLERKISALGFSQIMVSFSKILEDF